MINLGTANLDHWRDDWTAVTLDGRRSAQFEETILITENGPEILTRIPKKKNNKKKKKGGAAAAAAAAAVADKDVETPEGTTPETGTPIATD